MAEVVRKLAKTIMAARKAPPGEGSRFAALQAALARRPDVRNPRALAAWIGRKKYGPKRFAELSARGRRG